MEKNEGFRVSPAMLLAALRQLTFGDLLMRCLYRTRPYEAVPGSANALHTKWRDIAIAYAMGEKTGYTYGGICRGIVADFDALPLNESLRKPRVGIVGEILVKYMPLANNYLVDLLEQEGAEALKASRRFDPPTPMAHIADLAKPFLSLGNQYGEGWFLCGEMAELLTEGVPNIVCIQPFACLPNHVVGKGVIKALKAAYPQANIAAVDYDPGASEVNQLNRIKLMLSAAKKNMA